MLKAVPRMTGFAVNTMPDQGVPFPGEPGQLRVPTESGSAGNDNVVRHLREAAEACVPDSVADRQELEITKIW